MTSSSSRASAPYRPSPAIWTNAASPPPAAPYATAPSIRWPTPSSSTTASPASPALRPAASTRAAPAARCPRGIDARGLAPRPAGDRPASFAQVAAQSSDFQRNIGTLLFEALFDRQPNPAEYGGLDACWRQLPTQGWSQPTRSSSPWLICPPSPPGDPMKPHHPLLAALLLLASACSQTPPPPPPTPLHAHRRAAAGGAALAAQRGLHQRPLGGPAGSEAGAALPGTRDHALRHLAPRGPGR